MESHSPDQEPHATPGSGRHRDTQALHRACDACKRRKVRCSGANPCQHCSRNRVNCSYTSSSGKATLLRLLQESQRRVQGLEAAWKHFMPDVDPDYAIRFVESGQNEPPLNITATQPASTSPAAPVFNDPVSPAITSSFAGQGDQFAGSSSPEPEFETIEALEWDETMDFGAITDGMGSLAISRKASGYMGPQSGTALLRYLQSVGNFLSEEGSTEGSNASLYAHPAVTQELSSKVSAPSFRSRCLDWYFTHFHNAYPLIHEGTFRAMFMGAIPKPKDGSWPVLLNTVLAVGALAGPESSIGFDTVLFREAQNSMSLPLFQRGSLHLVQAFALMANYLQKRNKPNSGFTYLGIAINMALGLGLHRELSDKSVSPFAMEIRRRVWWTLFIFDSGARLTFGRPSVSLSGANVTPPANLDDSDIAVDVGEVGPSADHPTAASSLIWQSRLAEISNLANSKLLQRRLPDQSEILSIDEQISSWSSALPGYFTSRLEPEYLWFDIPRMVLRWRAQHLRIVITRPFLLEVIRNRQQINLSSPTSPVYICVSAAQDCIRSIVAFHAHQDSSPGALIWYATYWLVTAVFVHVTCMIYDPLHASAAVWRGQIEDSKKTLEQMASTEPVAERALSILYKVMELVPQSPSSTTITSNEQIRMGIADIWSESWLYDADLVNSMAFDTAGDGV